MTRQGHEFRVEVSVCVLCIDTFSTNGKYQDYFDAEIFLCAAGCEG